MKFIKTGMSLLLIFGILSTATGCSLLLEKVEENIKTNQTQSTDNNLILKTDITLMDSLWTIKIMKDGIIKTHDNTETKMLSDDIIDAKVVKDKIIYINKKSSARPIILVDPATGISTEIVKDSMNDKLFISNNYIYYKDTNRIRKIDVEKQKIDYVTTLSEDFELNSLNENLLKVKLLSTSTPVYKTYDTNNNSLVRTENEKGEDISNTFNNLVSKTVSNLLLDKETNTLYVIDEKGNKSKPLFEDKVNAYTRRINIIYFICIEKSTMSIKKYDILSGRTTKLIDNTDGKTFSVTTETTPNIYYSHNQKLFLYNETVKKSTQIAEGTVFNITLTSTTELKYKDENETEHSINLTTTK